MHPTTTLWPEAANRVRFHLNLEVPCFHSTEQFMKCLQEYVNHLLVNDFQKLIQLLYRMDISEERIRAVLEEKKQEDAGLLIAALMIERELAKARSREEYRQTPPRKDPDVEWAETW